MDQLPHSIPETSALFEKRAARFFQGIGKTVMVYMNYIGGVAMLSYQACLLALRGKIEWRSVLDQMSQLGVKSLALTNIVALFTGMVLALQFIVGLRRFGIELYTGQVVGIAIVRELGPVLTAIMIAARVGSGIAAELGSMAVSEQVMAIQAMGANPIIKLVLPRILVTTLITPLLTIIADVVGIFGGMIVSFLEAGVGPSFYLDQVLKTVGFDDFFNGLLKTFVFGFLIGGIACFQGLSTTRGTQEVGQSTTRSVVISALAVFVADYFLTKFLILILQE